MVLFMYTTTYDIDVSVNKVTNKRISYAFIKCIEQMEYICGGDKIDIEQEIQNEQRL